MNIDNVRICEQIMIDNVRICEQKRLRNTVKQHDFKERTALSNS
jgi:hypothetical protein